MKINKVIVTIIPAREDFVGQVEEGQYTFEDGEVSLVSTAGSALYDKQGKAFSRKLAPEEDAHQAAGRLLRAYYESKNKRSSFNRKINYPKLGIA